MWVTLFNGFSVVVTSFSRILQDETEFPKFLSIFLCFCSVFVSTDVAHVETEECVMSECRHLVAGIHSYMYIMYIALTKEANRAELLRSNLLIVRQQSLCNRMVPVAESCNVANLYENALIDAATIYRHQN